jgi:mono/diheme cytochrome c family protein
MRFPFYIAALVLGLAGCAGPASATDSAGDPIAGGRKLYLTKCAKCHKLYDPAKYSDAEWALWMEKMSRKSKLKPEQERLVSQYVEERLRVPQKPVARPSER